MKSSIYHLSGLILQNHTFFILAFERLLTWCVGGQCQAGGLFYKDTDVSKEYDQTGREQV